MDEWIEEVKRMWHEDGYIDDKAFYWLIEQAERVQELETTVDFYQSALKDADRRVQELELEVNDWRDEVKKWQRFYEESEESHLETMALLRSTLNQNKRYREAINNINEKAMFFGTNEEVYDAIQDAIRILEGTE